MRGRGKRPRSSRPPAPKSTSLLAPMLRSGVGVIVGRLFSRHWGLFRALVIYAASLSVLLGLYSWLNGTRFVYRFLEYNAQATGFLARLFDPAVTVSGTTVTSGWFAAAVVEGCTSLAPLAIFVSAVLAVPARLPFKILGILLGFVALSGVNLVRTTSLVYIGSAFPSALEVVHLLVWQSLMVVFAVALWLAWRRKWGQHGQS